MPSGFFGTRAVRGGACTRHKAVQLTLFIVLGAAVLAFELHMRQLGGVFVATQALSYPGSAELNGRIYVHTVFAIGIALTWILLVAGAPWLFPRPPRPVAGSHLHRWLGRVGMVLALGAGVTAISVYIGGFALELHT
jgi:hypothetical protein